MDFSERIFLNKWFSFLEQDKSSTLEAKATVFCLRQVLGLGRRALRSLSILGHLMGSTMSTSPCQKLTTSEITSSMFLNKLPSSSSAALGRISTSTVRQSLTSSLIFSEYFAGISSYSPLMTFLKSEGKSEALKGCLSVQSSQIRQPVAQISHLLPYSKPFHISGLVQQGVPVCVEQSPFSAILETFRSPSLATPSTKNTFALLMSRWMTLFLCRILSPCRISNATFHTKFSSKPSPA